MNYSLFINYFKTLNCKILENEPMFKHTSFKIGGPADLFVEVYSLESLKKILTFLKILINSMIITHFYSNLKSHAVRKISICLFMTLE